MLRVFPWVGLWLAVAATACQAQIVSNPVVTSWPTGTTLTTYPMPAAPVSADVCVPPVVTFCHPCAMSATPATTVPVTSLLVPRPMSVPVTAYQWPVQTVLRPVTVNSVPVTVTRVYRPMWQTAAPSIPETTRYAPTALSAPVTSSYAPSASPSWSVPASSSVMPSAPVSGGGGCNCQGR